MFSKFMPQGKGRFKAIKHFAEKKNKSLVNILTSKGPNIGCCGLSYTYNIYPVSNCETYVNSLCMICQII